MKITSFLRQIALRMASWTKTNRGNTGANSFYYRDIEEQLRVMSDQEFSEYLRLHTKRLHRGEV